MTHARFRLSEKWLGCFAFSRNYCFDSILLDGTRNGSCFREAATKRWYVELPGVINDNKEMSVACCTWWSFMSRHKQRPCCQNGANAMTSLRWRASGAWTWTRELNIGICAPCIWRGATTAMFIVFPVLSSALIREETFGDRFVKVGLRHICMLC